MNLRQDGKRSLIVMKINSKKLKLLLWNEYLNNIKPTKKEQRLLKKYLDSSRKLKATFTNGEQKQLFHDINSAEEEYINIICEHAFLNGFDIAMSLMPFIKNQ